MAKRHSPQSGFSLIELMIALAILAVISSIGYQLYTGYIDTADETVLSNNIDSMRMFQEDVRLRTGSYAAGSYDLSAGDTSLTTAIGWEPDDPDGTITYVVDTVASGAGYTVTATAVDGTHVERCFGQGCP